MVLKTVSFNFGVKTKITHKAVVNHTSTISKGMNFEFLLVDLNVISLSGNLDSLFVTFRVFDWDSGCFGCFFVILLDLGLLIIYEIIVNITVKPAKMRIQVVWGTFTKLLNTKPSKNVKVVLKTMLDVISLNLDKF